MSSNLQARSSDKFSENVATDTLPDDLCTVRLSVR